MVILFLFIFFHNSLNAQVNSEVDEFTFIFATDIHLFYDHNSIDGYNKAIEEINKLKPDFVLTGGDLIMDALGVNFGRADSLYNLYIQTIKSIEVPIYNTIGNHEIFGLYKESQVPRNHEEFGKKMFNNRLGKSYYSFMHKGVKFLVLDSIEETPEGSGYYGYISDNQIDWIKNELIEMEKTTPIIVSTHIPFITTQTQLDEGSLTANSRSLVISNSKEVLDLFKDYSLKLVLQGHLHFYEDLNIQDKVRFVTGGAVSAKWWNGTNNGMEEGFTIVRVTKDKINVEYHEYNWDPEVQ
jgi:3',5'-cyclic AMP phosphodiesterase CpdA